MKPYYTVLRTAILDSAAFIRATFSGRQRGHELAWKKLVIRPVTLKGQPHLQFSYFDDTQNITKNYTGTELTTQLDKVLALPFRNFFVETGRETIQINLSKKGKALIKRTPVKTEKKVDLSHDRQKKTVLVEGEPYPFLQVLGLSRPDNHIKAHHQSKFRQINAFLHLLTAIKAISSLPEPIRVVDFGCGSAYLTFATYHYLHNMLGKAVEIVGVDLKQHLVEKNNALAAQLGWPTLRFVHQAIGDYQAHTPPNIVVALHACDTASDDALAQAVLWQSKVVLVAPCCHHDLQVQLKEGTVPAGFNPIMQYGLLHEHMGDILTDTFRALILRLMGYKVSVVQFVAPDHTPKNLLLRASHTGNTNQPNLAAEYQQLQDLWQVTPHLHKLLDTQIKSRLQPHDPK